MNRSTKLFFVLIAAAAIIIGGLAIYDLTHPEEKASEPKIEMIEHDYSIYAVYVFDTPVKLEEISVLYDGEALTDYTIRLDHGTKLEICITGPEYNDVSKLKVKLI